MSLIEVRALSKNYGGLRPFRLQSLVVEPGEFVTIEGPDLRAAAVLTDLLTGTVLPDEGAVIIDGRSTAQLSGEEEWLSFLDRFGLVNERVALLDELPVGANLAVPLTLDLDPMPAGVRRTVEAIAADVGLDAGRLDAPLRGETPLSRFRVRLGRAVALDPAIVVVEHPTVDLGERRDAAAAAETLRRVHRLRGAALVLIASDRRIPRNVTGRTLSWQAATGETRETGGWRRWFS